MLSKPIEEAAKEIAKNLDKSYRENALDNLEAFVLSLLQITKKNMARPSSSVTYTLIETCFRKNLQEAKQALEKQAVIT